MIVCYSLMMVRTGVESRKLLRKYAELAIGKYQNFRLKSKGHFLFSRTFKIQLIIFAIFWIKIRIVKIVVKNVT